MSDKYHIRVEEGKSVKLVSGNLSLRELLDFTNILSRSFLFGAKLLQITTSILYFHSENRKKSHPFFFKKNPDHWGWKLVKLFPSKE